MQLVPMSQHFQGSRVPAPPLTQKPREDLIKHEGLKLISAGQCGFKYYMRVAL